MHWPLPVRRVTPVATSYNTVFRVLADRTYALRIAPGPRIHRAGCAVAEARWSDALNAAGVRVPHVVRLPGGEPSVAVGGREVMLLEWIRGRAVAVPARVPDAQGLGELAGRLHAVSPAMSHLPDGVLDGRRVAVFDVPGTPRLEGEPLATAARERCAAELEALWRCRGAAARIVHLDLRPANVLRVRGGLAAIDLQDLAWALPEQDLAASLYGLDRDVRGPLDAAFRRGYTRAFDGADEVLAALDAHLTMLLAARRLTMLQVAATFDPQGLAERIERHRPALRAYAERNALP